MKSAISSCCCEHGPHLSISEQSGGQRAPITLLDQRGKPIFTLFHGCTFMTTGTTVRKPPLHYHGIQTDFGAQAVALPPYTKYQPFSAPQPRSILNARKIPRHPGIPARAGTTRDPPQERGRCPVLAWARVPMVGSAWPSAACRRQARGARLFIPSSPDWCQLPAAPGLLSPGAPRTEAASAQNQKARSSRWPPRR